MTVCISAITAKSKAIVCIADRALTYAGWGANTETDSGLTKIIDLAGNWCAMFSGDSLTFPKRVLDRVAEQLKTTPKIGLTEMERCVKEAFEFCWWQEVEDQVLKPNLLTRDEYANRPSDKLPLDSDLVMKLAKEMSEYKQNCSMIFCGFDGDTPHIFTAATPCQLDPYDWQGFAVIGGGMEAARNQMIWQEYDKDDSLQSGLYDVFSSKVAAENTQGVGYSWDWRVLVEGKKPRPLPRKIDSLIDKLWIVHNRSPFARKTQKYAAAPKGWERTLRDFETDALSARRKKPTEKLKRLGQRPGRRPPPTATNAGFLQSE